MVLRVSLLTKRVMTVNFITIRLPASNSFPRISREKESRILTPAMKRGNYEVLQFLMSAVLLKGAADDRQLSGPLKKLPSEILNLSLQAKEFKINVSSQVFF